MEENKTLSPMFVDILVTDNQELLILAYGVRNWTKDFITVLKEFGISTEENFCSPCG